MLTRLKVDGFKNLNGVDVRFGPFTCIAGANGVGKSNIFDAIAFLSALADKPLMEAALAVRGGDARRGDVAGLFHRVGDQVADRMSFHAEMIIPKTGLDFINQPTEASCTTLAYDLVLERKDNASRPGESLLAIAEESMVSIPKTRVAKMIGFHHAQEWRASVELREREGRFIRTDDSDDGPEIHLHTDNNVGKGRGRPRRAMAATLPRTMLSTASLAAEHQTLVLARREMMGWTQLQLEPSALRAPDDFNTAPGILPSGAHLPVTLYELAEEAEQAETGGAGDVYARIASRLYELVENVRELRVDVDKARRLYSVVLTDGLATEHVAGALSDGTLRFLALAVMESLPSGKTLLCLEEPENGMHPKRIPAMVRLLGDLAVDVSLPVDVDNPLRQVIINTHSPSVVNCVHDDALLVARLDRVTKGAAREGRFALRHLTRTWRQQRDRTAETARRGDVEAYLDPIAAIDPRELGGKAVGATPLVLERNDLQQRLPFVAAEP